MLSCHYTSVFLQRRTLNMAQEAVLVLFQQRPGLHAAVRHSIKVILPLGLCIICFCPYSTLDISLCLPLYSSFSSRQTFITSYINTQEVLLKYVGKSQLLFFLVFFPGGPYLNTVHHPTKDKNDIANNAPCLPFPHSYFV